MGVKGDRMRWLAALMMTALLAGCVTPVAQPPQSAPVATEAAYLPPREAARNFITAVAAMEPVVERACRARIPNNRCDFQIVVDDRRDQPPNAFQTIDKQGRPILGFTLALIADARNVDEIAFVMGHEAAHHILGHIPQQQQSATQGALIAGILVAAGGGGSDAIENAQKIGASLGARRFSKGFELEADALGTELTEEAGFDALRGANFFSRIPDPGDQFLGTHPPNAARMDTVRQVVSRLR
jgi:Zn-dependent protease with chaperone function